MGVETDFVLATPNQAEAVLTSIDPAKEFGGVYAKGTDPISMGALQAVLTGDRGSDDFFEDYREVASDRDRERSILAVPTELREAIAAIPEAGVKNVVANWVGTEEFMLTGWDDQIAMEFIVGLKNLLAGQGAAEKELWMVISV
jgi:hypothetical protein